MKTLPGVFDAHGGNDELHTGCVKEMFGSAALSWLGYNAVQCYMPE